MILQVNRSHLDRMVDYLVLHCLDDNCGITSDDDKVAFVVRIIATRKSTASKSCSLLFLRVDSSSSVNVISKRAVLDFVEYVTKQNDYVLRGLNKMYVLSSGNGCDRLIMKGCITSSLLDDGGNGVAVTGNINRHHENNNNNEEYIDRRLLIVLQKLKQRYAHTHKSVVVVKVDVFPMKFQHQIVTNITALLNAELIPEEELDISPTNYTHALSVVQIDDAEQHHNKANKYKQEKTFVGTFLVGMAPLALSACPIYPAALSASDDDDIICRAYRKLEEVFVRYQQLFRPEVDTDATAPSMSGLKRRLNASTFPQLAVDCGSAPGGWTKYLAERTSFDVIYSIDPAEMDLRVISLPKVRHLQMTCADAVPYLCDHVLPLYRDLIVDDVDDDGNGVTDFPCKVSLWVSDMCVHEYTSQVDTFLRVRDMGILNPDACAFVLTLKFCNAGHGRGRYDEYAEVEARRLRVAGAYGVKVMHLFSNRLSERTLAGFM